MKTFCSQVGMANTTLSTFYVLDAPIQSDEERETESRNIVMSPHVHAIEKLQFHRDRRDRLRNERRNRETAAIRNLLRPEGFKRDQPQLRGFFESLTDSRRTVEDVADEYAIENS